MNTAVETNLYRAKAGIPRYSMWQTGWTTREKAEAAAREYVQQWAEIGVKDAQANVFYRDGSVVTTMKGNP